MRKTEQKCALMALVLALGISCWGWQYTSRPAPELPLHHAAGKRSKQEPPAPTSATDLYAMLVDAKIPFPTVFTQVAVTESGWMLESEVARKNHNYFGFIHPGARWSYSLGEQLGHANYPSAEAAIHDLKLWIAMNPPLPNEDPYQYLARRGYNPNPGYYAYVASINLCAGQPTICQLKQAGG